MSRISKKEQVETTQDLFWQLLRALEERCGNNAGALDRELIRASYRHYNNIHGTNLEPSYVGTGRKEHK